MPQIPYPTYNPGPNLGQSLAARVRDALASVSARRAAAEEADARQAQLQLQRDTLAQGAKDHAADRKQQADLANASLAQNYTLHGFRQAPATAGPVEPVGGSPIGRFLSGYAPPAARVPAAFEEAKPNPVFGAFPSGRIPSPATSGAPAAAAWTYDPTADPEEVRAGRERTFKAGESQKDRDLNLGIARGGWNNARTIAGMNNATSLRAAEIGANASRFALAPTANGVFAFNTRTGEATPLRDAAGQPVKPKVSGNGGAPSEYERKAAFMLPGAISAIEVLNAHDSTPNLWDSAMEGTPLVGNSLMSSERQQQIQAAMTLHDAYLRLTTGATIQPSELRNAAMQYIPERGDKPAVLALKHRRRAQVEAAIRGAASRALPRDSDDGPSVQNMAGSALSRGGDPRDAQRQEYDQAAETLRARGQNPATILGPRP